MTVWTWLALTPLATLLLWGAWWSWSYWRKDVRAAKAAAHVARAYTASPSDDLGQAAMGKHHRPEPNEEPAWPTVDPDEPVKHVNPVRPYVQDTLSTSLMRRPVFHDDTPTVPNPVRLAGLKAIEELGFGTSEPGEHGKHPHQSTGLRHDRHSDGLPRDRGRAAPGKGRHALDDQ